MIRPAALVLADGSVFEGELFGAEAPDGVASGEVVFNTVLSRLPGGDHRPVATPGRSSPSPPRTSATTASTPTDFESRRPFCRGVIVREMARRHSNHRAEASLDAMLTRYGISGIGGIDTRRLTRLLRDTGAMPGAFGTADESVARAAAAGRARHRRHRSRRPGHHARAVQPSAAGARLIVAYDFGIKQHDPARPRRASARVEVVPASTTAAEMLALQPDGVFLSNGPGDPAMVGLRRRHDRRPARRGAGVRHLPRSPAAQPGASVARRSSCPFGHHGGNHPVRHEPTGQVEITSQNHNFCVDPERIADRVDVTHLNLNDSTERGHAGPTARRRSACSTTRRPGPVRTTAATCSRCSPR